MNIQGMGLFIFALALVLIFIGVYPFFGKKILKIRWVWIGIGTFMFIYYLAGRVIPCLIELAHPIKMYDGVLQSQTGDNVRLSNVLMLDMCPMMAFSMPLLAVFEKKRMVLSFIAPIALFAGLLSIFGGVFKDFDGGWTGVNGNPYNDGVVAHFTAKYIFIGNTQDHLFWMMHMFIITLAIMTLLSTEKVLWFNMVGSLGCALVMAAYAAIFAYSLNVKTHAFGVIWEDWAMTSDNKQLGEFSAVTDVVVNIFKISKYWAIPIGFVLAIGFCVVNTIGFYGIRRIKFNIIYKNFKQPNEKKIIAFKPFQDVEDVSLTKKEEIIKMWKTNWRLQ